MCPKLTAAHIYLSTAGTMRVKLAAQIFSHSVAAALQRMVMEGCVTAEEAAGTIELVSKMNILFDYCNATVPFLPSSKFAVSYDNLCSRLTDLEDIKQWIRCWTVVNEGTGAVQNMLPFQKGWICTISSLQSLLQELIGGGTFTFLATRRLNQDAVENLFSVIRRNKGGFNNHPNAIHCMSMLGMLSCNMLMSLKSPGRNCTDDDDAATDSDAYLRVIHSHNLLPLNSSSTHIQAQCPLSDPSRPSVQRAAKSSSLSQLWHSAQCSRLSAIEEDVVEYILGAGIRRLIKNLSCASCSNFFSSKTNTRNRFISLKDFTNMSALFQPHKLFLKSFGRFETLFRKTIFKLSTGQTVLAKLRNMCLKLGDFSFLPSCHRSYTSNFLVSYFLRTRLHYYCKCRTRDVISKQKLVLKFRRLNVCL